MKKLMMVLLVGAVVLAMSGLSLANEGMIGWGHFPVQDTVHLKAFVHPYAKVEFLFDNPKELFLTGEANQSDSWAVPYVIESNCPVTAYGMGTQFKGIVYGDRLKTDYATQYFWFMPSWKPAYTVMNAGTANCSLTAGLLSYQASTGEHIRSQHADTYKASYTITVYAD